MKDLSGKNFGLLIAYIVPGAIPRQQLTRFSIFNIGRVDSLYDDLPTKHFFLLIFVK